MSSDIETKLLDLGKWAIHSAQLAGYIPVSIMKEKNSKKSLRFGPFCSNPIIFYILGLLSFAGIWGINFFWNVQIYQKYVALFGPTGKLFEL
jgi:hypothetical protein